MERQIKFRAWDKENKIMSEGLPFEWFIRGEGTDMELRKNYFGGKRLRVRRAFGFSVSIYEKAVFQGIPK